MDAIVKSRLAEAIDAILTKLRYNRSCNTHTISPVWCTLQYYLLSLSQEPNKSKKDPTRQQQELSAVRGYQSYCTYRKVEGTHFDTHQIAHYTVMWHSDTVQAVILSIACDMHHYVCILGNI